MESNIPYLCDRCKHVNTCDCAYDEYNRVINDDWTDDCLGMKQMGDDLLCDAADESNCPYLIHVVVDNIKVVEMIP